MAEELSTRIRLAVVARLRAVALVAADHVFDSPSTNPEPKDFPGIFVETASAIDNNRSMAGPEALRVEAVKIVAIRAAPQGLDDPGLALARDRMDGAVRRALKCSTAWQAGLDLESPPQIGGQVAIGVAGGIRVAGVQLTLTLRCNNDEELDDSGLLPLEGADVRLDLRKPPDHTRPPADEAATTLDFEE